MPQLPEAQSFAREWTSAWNAHDLEKILEHYSDDIEFHSPFAAKFAPEGGGVVHGKGNLRLYFGRALEAFPDLHFEMFHVLTSVRSITLFYRSVNNLLAAEIMSFDDHGTIKLAIAHYTPAPSVVEI
jgi:hypothetical protein